MSYPQHDPLVTRALAMAESENSPGLPEGVTKYALLDMLDEIGSAFGLDAADLRYLRVATRRTRTSDWSEAGEGPVCYVTQKTLAQDLGIDRSNVLRAQQRLERCGIIAVRTADNGARGRWLDETGTEIRAGISFAPLIALYPAVVEAREAYRTEQARLDGLRWTLRKEKKAVRVLLDACAERCGLVRLAAKIADALATVPQRTSRIANSVALEKLIGVVRALKETLSAALTSNEGGENAVGAEKSHHARSADASPYIHNTTRLIPVTCNGLEKKPAAGVSTTTPGLSPVETPDTPLTPKQIYAAATEEFRFYLEGSGESWADRRALTRAAGFRRSEIGISEDAWSEAVQVMGEVDAAISVMVIDRNRSHPTTPIGKPGGALRAFTRRAKDGELRLAASVFGILNRNRLANA